MELTEKQIASERVFSGRLIKVNRDTVSLPNGKTATREVVIHPGAVAIAAVTDEGELLMVRQYRYPAGQALLEIPAGKLEPGEEPYDCAVRELREETGATAKDMTYAGYIYPTPGYNNEKIHLYLAEKLTFGQTNFDEDEFLEIERIPLIHAYKMCENNEIVDGKTLSALLKLKLQKNI